jgi:hypothetical protein
MLRTSIHYGIHFLLPLIIALIWYKPRFTKVYFIFLLGFIIDLDHLFATPMFSPDRCSINYHFMHSYYAIAVYFGLLFLKKTRLIAIGLICHIIADSADCVLLNLGY